MERRIAVLVAVVAVLAVSVTTAVAVTVTHDDGNRVGPSTGMVSPQWDDRADGSGDWHRPGRQGRGGMGPRGMAPGTMHGVGVRTEYAYLAEMVAHHEEAVAAARHLRRSPRAEMRAFGQAIVASQSAQIVQMRQWLADWYPDRPEQVDYEPMMRDLTGLSGDRLDRVFLQDMLGHHMVAVMMSQGLLMRGVADHAQVEALAETIRDEQHAEIFQMRRWLRAWFGGRLATSPSPLPLPCDEPD